MIDIEITVNGSPVNARVEPRTSLADFLRDHLWLTGTHLGCEHGVCGACSVLVDGAPARSCITYAVACDGATVVTVEGLDDDPLARALREAFTAHHGLQCGYCTPGMLITACDVVTRLPKADKQRIREELSGNLCRCTGYVGIVNAIHEVIVKRNPEAVSTVLAVRDRLGPVGSGRVAEARASEAQTPVRSAAARSAPRADANAVSAEQWAAVAAHGTEIVQSFSIPYSRERVWQCFSDPEVLLACMPGARVLGRDAAGDLECEWSVKLGPISAVFAGTAQIVLDAGRYQGQVRGAGQDRRSTSRAHGIVTYRLTSASADATDVQVTMKFLLAGALAQFSRAGLVQDVARQITGAFTHNLEQRLSGVARRQRQEVEVLDAGRIARRAVWQRIRHWFRWLWQGAE